jgi:replicative DNA helicase
MQNSRTTNDRLPPHSPEAEQGVLACILLDYQTVMPLCIEKLRTDAWYDLRHKTIYEVCSELFDDQVGIDSVTLYSRLKLWDQADQVGGITYISTLPDVVPSAANVEEYIDILNDKAALRAMIHICADVTTRAYEANGDASEVIDQCEKDILQAAQARVDHADVSIQNLVHSAIDDFEAAIHSGGQAQGIQTGFADLDKLSDGLHAGEMIVLAARPAMGKTSLALNIVDHVAINLGLPVGVFSLEMTAKELVKRLISCRARVNIRNIGTENFSQERDVPRLTIASNSIRHARLFIDDTAGLSIMQLRAKARRWWQQHQIKLVVIDYLQLLTATGGRMKIESRQQEVSMISVGCKSLAKELGVPVVVLCQLNRDIERDKHRKPRLSDLRESGSIEQDADVVGMLYKPSNDEDDNYNDYAEPISLLLAKQRNGPSGVSVQFTFLKNYTRFESAAKVTDEDVPQQQNSINYAE